MKISLFIVLCLTFSLYSEDLTDITLGDTNLNYQKSRIKSKAKHSKSTDRVCYQYVEITSTKEWNKRKDELNTYIRNNKNRCKKYIIYKEVRNVHTKNHFGSDASNNNKGDYKINIGVIMEENPEVDIEIYTQVKNSTLQDRTLFSDKKANVGSVVIETDDDIDLDNSEIKAVSNIEDSQVGNLDVFSEFGLNETEKFLKEDKDDPFND